MFALDSKWFYFIPKNSFSQNIFLQSIKASELISEKRIFRSHIFTLGIVLVFSLLGQVYTFTRNMELEIIQKICKEGGYRYDNGCVYVGAWNSNGKQHGQGHLQLADGTRYDGVFEDGFYNGLGVLAFPDGAKYEGEFMNGWFHGCGIFWRADGMKHEGEFRGGKIWGLGLTTFSDGSNGFPRSEGFYKQCKLIRKKKCPEIIQRAQKIAFMARTQFDKVSASF